MFIKQGEAIQIAQADIQDHESILVDASVLDNFKRFASDLKKIAPKAEDFLYFSTIMMSSAESACINDDGTPKLNKSGEVVKGGWDKSNNTWKWVSNDPSIKPYKNANGDIFPEEELVKAYKKWVGKPLCIDHKSSSVDHVRGFIVDTYYDRSLKRVIALCALDKKNYPDLAFKVSSGYSNNVSMGTAVGRAVCFDCGKMARVESDFCGHMKNRTTYGEINLDLSPIELSIVVNGADPKAKIKHIIAAAQTLNSYVETKSAELEKLASRKYYATIGSSNEGDVDGNGNTSSYSLEASDIDTLKNDIDKALEDLNRINSSINEEKEVLDANDLTSNQESGKLSTAEVAPDTCIEQAATGSEFASEEFSAHLAPLMAEITAKLNQMQSDLTKLANKFNTSKEENMSGSKEDLNKKAYYQGAGGVNEPEMGKVKYTVDPGNDKARAEDHHMHGQSPFPGVGSVDGLHPSPESVGGDELARKKMLARATAEERAMKREAVAAKVKTALETKKTAYYQGAGGVNEPEMGKVKYPADPGNDKARAEDHHMHGQSPFPGVGDVDGLHPSPESVSEKNELERKKKLSRASTALRAKFVNASRNDGSDDLGNSAWEVYAGDKLVLKASVNEISGFRAEALFAGIATEKFGQDLMRKVREQGAVKTASSLKAKFAQDAAPAAAPEAPAADAAPAAPAADDSGADGDKKEATLELAEKVRDLSSDLVEAVRALTGEQAEMGEMDGLSADDSKVSTANLDAMRQELNLSLTEAMVDAVSALDSHQAELVQLAELHSSKVVTASNKEILGSIYDSAVAEAKEAVASSLSLLGAFVKYARGTQALQKRAAEEAEMDSNMSDDDLDDTLMAMMSEDEDLGDADAPPAPVAAAPVAPAAVPAAPKTASRSDRAALRAKLAADLQQNTLLHDAHPQTYHLPLDVKPSGDADVVENVKEQQDKILAKVLAPVKIQREAASIQKLIVAGKVAANQLDTLVKAGLDAEAVAYWKKFYGEGDSESKEFATEMVKEHAAAAVEADKQVFRAKIARAYELTYEMVDRGLVEHQRSAITANVDSIMECDDAGFENIKRVVAMSAPAVRKTASRLPSVGLIGSGDAFGGGEQTLESELTAALSKRSTKRSF
jgi:hypothetical protein